MNTDFIRRMILPVALAGRGELGYYRELKLLREIVQSGEQSLAEVRKLRLQGLLRAAARTPYYRSFLGEPDFGDPFSALAEVPLLSKTGLQDHIEELRNSDAGRVTRKTTGGSTGQAVTVFKNSEAVARERAASTMGYSWFGIRPGDRAVRFWGTGRSARRKIKSWLADAVMNRRTLSAFAFGSDDLDRYWDFCLHHRPRYFYGYASMIEEFARHGQARGLPGRELGLRAVVVTSEPVTEAGRKLIEHEFGAPVQNEYGCGEVGPIAYECQAGSLHVMTQNLEVEILDPSGNRCPPGVAGEVVVTDLNNIASPLLRYSLGDRASWGNDCACGLPFPVFDQLHGREYDYVEDIAGRRYHGEAVMYIMEDLRDAGESIAAFQVIQARPGEVQVLLVAPVATDDLEERIGEMFATRLGGMRASIERRSEIPRASSGKQRLIRRVSEA